MRVTNRASPETVKSRSWINNLCLLTGSLYAVVGEWGRWQRSRVEELHPRQLASAPVTGRTRSPAGRRQLQSSNSNAERRPTAGGSPGRLGVVSEPVSTETTVLQRAELTAVRGTSQRRAVQVVRRAVSAQSTMSINRSRTLQTWHCLTLWCPLLSYGYSYKASCARLS